MFERTVDTISFFFNRLGGGIGGRPGGGGIGGRPGGGGIGGRPGGNGKSLSTSNDSDLVSSFTVALLLNY